MLQPSRLICLPLCFLFLNSHFLFGQTTSELGSGAALDFNGSYVEIANPAGLNLAEFTLECWFRVDGTGTPILTAEYGGIAVIPVLAKGVNEKDTCNCDMNYLLGLGPASLNPVADFEESPDGVLPGLNHPITAAAGVAIGEWHHMAASYDGATWKLYLDGKLDSQLPLDLPPNTASAFPVTLGTALDESGNPAGSFDGAIDEVRIWNHARDLSEIQSLINSVPTGTEIGLLGYWSFDDSTAADITGNGFDGTLNGAGFSWDAAAPFDLTINSTPEVSLVGPVNEATCQLTSVELSASVLDSDTDTVSVTFWGRKLLEGRDRFSLVDFGDSQFYTQNTQDAARLEIFRTQSRWVANAKDSLNIEYVHHLGDCSQNGDKFEDEWIKADSVMSILEDSIGGIEFPYGMPYSVCVGNHDQTGIFTPLSSNKYNDKFGKSRFDSKGYLVSAYKDSMNNHIDSFNAEGLAFLIALFDYQLGGDEEVFDWANGVLDNYPSKRILAGSHFIFTSTGEVAGTGNLFMEKLADVQPELFLLHSADMRAKLSTTTICLLETPFMAYWPAMGMKL